MRINKNIFTEFLNQFDLLNTINGGISMTSVKVEVQKDQYIIKVHTPGIDKYAYQVEVVNNMILIYILLNIEKNDGPVQVPSFMRYLTLPSNSNTEEIHAIHEDGELKVIIPLDTPQNQKQRKINIDYL
ncbi:MAG: Hsp20 family protein [Bacteroidota bacterium]|nr:Hsp20 family protein [Bacteroidota bacterium]